MEPVTLQPIGRVICTRTGLEDDHWDAEESIIELDETIFSEESALGLDRFSHLEVVYHLHLVDPAKAVIGSRRPRNNPAWPRMGVLAQRFKNRFNRLGLTVVRLEGLDGLRLRVSGLDAVDGAPVLDIKPYFRQFGPRGPVRQPDWVDEMLTEYWA